MGISVVGNNSSDYGFWIFYGKAGYMSSIEVYNEKGVIPYIERFFIRDFKNLDNDFNQ